MKTIAITFTSILVMISFVFTPMLDTAFAVESKTSPFCTNLSARVSTISGQVTSTVNKVNQAWAQQDQKRAAEYQKVDQDVAADRQKADTNRAANFTKLEAKATTDAQKQAVQAYEAAVKNAVNTRRSSYDTARQTFRSGVKSAIAARRSAITTQLNQFQGSVSSAIATAEASCHSTPNNGLSIRQTLVASLKAARQTFQSDRKNDETVGSQVKTLAATRNSTFKATDQTFRTSLTTARMALKQAFINSKTAV